LRPHHGFEGKTHHWKPNKNKPDTSVATGKPVEVFSGNNNGYAESEAERPITPIGSSAL